MAIPFTLFLHILPPNGIWMRREPPAENDAGREWPKGRERDRERERERGRERERERYR